MKWTIIVFISFALMGLPILLSAQEEVGDLRSASAGGESYDKPIYLGNEEAPSPPLEGRHFRGPRSGRRGGFPGLAIRQFRGELLALRREIMENKHLVQSLEEELEEMPPGIERAEVRKKLAEAQRRQAELELTVAQRRVEITRQARDIAQQRYDDARLELKKVKRKVRKKYPDLVPPKISPQEKF